MLDFKRYNPMLCYLVDLQDFLDLSKELNISRKRFEIRRRVYIVGYSSKAVHKDYSETEFLSDCQSDWSL